MRRAAVAAMVLAALSPAALAQSPPRIPDLAGVWVEDTDFFKVRNIGVAYRLPVQNTFLSRLEVGINLRNPLVFGSSSFDPEVTGAGIAAQGGFAAGGFGFGTESAPKEYLFTVRLGF